MGVQKRVRVAEDLQVDAPEGRIGSTTCKLDRFAEPVHAVQELQAPGSGQVSQAADTGVVSQQDAVTGKPLDIPDDREARREPRKHRRILSP